MSTFKHTLSFIALMGGVASQPALAQDANLYANAASPDASYIRVIAPRQSPATIADDSFAELQNGVSPYVMIAQPGKVAITAGSAATEADIAKGSWNTYLVGADGSGHMVSDPLTHSPAQADVTFYNISDLDGVDLYVPAAKRAAIKAVNSGQGEWIALKAPLSLEFQARNGDEVLASADDVGLVRREGTTLVFRGQDGHYELIALQAATTN